jgi:hypothetical protein
MSPRALPDVWGALAEMAAAYLRGYCVTLVGCRRSSAQDGMSVIFRHHQRPVKGKARLVSGVQPPVETSRTRLDWGNPVESSGFDSLACFPWDKWMRQSYRVCLAEQRARFQPLEHSWSAACQWVYREIRNRHLKVAICGRVNAADLPEVDRRNKTIREMKKPT